MYAFQKLISSRFINQTYPVFRRISAFGNRFQNSHSTTTLPTGYLWRLAFPSFNEYLTCLKWWPFKFSIFENRVRYSKTQKILVSRKQCDIERLRQNFLSKGGLWRLAFPSFKEFFTPQKWWPFWIFKFFKNAKHENACISKTMLVKAILMKILIHGVNLLSSWPNFKNKSFVLPKMEAIWDFSHFWQNLVSRKWDSDFGKNFDPQGICED